MFENKKELLNNLLNDKEYIESLSVTKELLENGSISTNKNFNAKQYKQINFMLYMYNYILSSNYPSKVYTINKISESIPFIKESNKIIDKINNLITYRKELIMYEQTISSNIFYALISSNKGLFIPKGTPLYNKINLNILTYLDMYLFDKELKLITYDTKEGIYFNYKEYYKIIKGLKY